MRIRIQLFSLMRIRIQLPKLRRIHADPGPVRNPGNTVHTDVADLMKLGFVISVAVSFPLVIFPCRTSIHSLLFRKVIFFSQSASNVLFSLDIPGNY
jgi:hypothetical protein